MSLPMPQYRCDPVSKHWVILAPERSRRPLGLSGSKPHTRRDSERDSCPFCEGQECETTDEVFAVRNPNSRKDQPGWSLRVVPNKFPAVRQIDGLTHATTEGMFHSFAGHGQHEVVIECPYHETNPTQFTDEGFRAVLMAYQQRIIAMSHNSDYSYAMVFKNVGAEAGASLAHSHSQIIAMPIVPDTIRVELENAREYYLQQDRCLFCAILADTLQTGTRVIEQSAHFLAIAPYAPRFAYETWILPRFHSSRYELLSTEMTLELARLMRLVLRKLDSLLGYPAYNYYLHNSPLRSEDRPDYHWHFEILPRTSRPAGFEWGSGTYINAVLPEVSAAELRDTIPLDQDSIFY